MLNEKLTWHFSPSLKDLKANSKKIPNKHTPRAVELNLSLSDKVKSNMWVFGIWTLKSSIKNPLELCSFHLSYWSMGVLNRKIYHLCISDLKPIYEGGWCLQYRKWRPFFKLVERILWTCFWCFKWSCLGFQVMYRAICFLVLMVNKLALWFGRAVGLNRSRSSHDNSRIWRGATPVSTYHLFVRIIIIFIFILLAGVVQYWL